MNINAKTLTAPKIHRPLLNGLWLVVAAVLRRVNAGYDDYELRGRVGEWTRDEVRAEILGDIANAERNQLADEFWTSGG